MSEKNNHNPDKDVFNNTPVSYLNNLLENMSELCYIYDTTGKVIFVNQKSREILGYTPHEAQGRYLWDFVPLRYRLRLYQQVKERLEIGQSGSYLMTVVHKNGEERIFQLKAAPVFEDNRIVGEMGLAEDITDHRRTEKELKQNHEALEKIQQELLVANQQLMATEEELRQQLDESEKNKDALANAHQQLESILDFLPDPTFVIDNMGKVTMWNRAMEQLTGVKPREILGKSNYEYSIPFYGKRRPMLIDLALNGSLRLKPDYLFLKTLDDTLLTEKFCSQLRVAGTHLSCKSSPLYDRKGCLIGAIETLRDISEQKEAESALQQSEEKYRNIIQNLDDGYFEVDLHGNYVFFNRALHQKLGYASNQFMGSNYRQHMDDLNGRKVLRTFNRVFTTGKPVKDFGWYVQKKDGTCLFVETTVLPIIEGQKVVGFRGIIRDISDRKRSEEQLQASEKNLKKQVTYLNTLINNLNELFFTYDRNGQMTFVNKKSLEVAGYGPDEMLGKHIADFVRRDYKEIVLDGIKKRLGHGQDNSYEIPILHKDGTQRIIKLNSSPIIDEEGNITGGMVLAEDISARKQAQEELEFSEARYRAIVEDQTELICRSRPDGTFTFVNEAFRRYFNQAIKASINNLNQLVYFGDSAMVRRTVLNLTPDDPVCNIEYRVVLPGGDIRWQQWTHRAIFDHTGAVVNFQSVGRDVTERRMTEEQLKYLSLHDSLTGLHNRFYFEKQMKHLEDGASNPVGLIMCDVDGLKLINDTMGHEQGDKLLKAVGRVLSSCFRSQDTVARVGGDEFAVLLPNTSGQVVEQAILRIRETADKYNQTNSRLPLSMSLGYAVRENNSITMGDLFREADNNMYRQKLHHGQSARSSIIHTLTKALESRDFITEGHACRLQILVERMGQALGLNEKGMNDLRLFAQFHDIGKVGVPDSILFKPGGLTTEEYDIIKRHSEIGHRIALSVPELVLISDWILKHHEWWNGQGYPLGLKGEEIPIECRVLAIADAYDCMTNDRPYRKTVGHKDALAELQKCAGVQFDPGLVLKFIPLLQEFYEEGCR